MKRSTLTPFLLFFLSVALPACQSGEPGSVGAAYGAQIDPPAECSNGDPTCNSAYDYPVQLDLSGTNMQNLVYSDTDGGLTLNPGSANIVDTDGDGVPDPADECAGVGWRLPCDGDASDDGIYQTLYFNAVSDITVRADIQISGAIQKADAYVLMDATGSMRGEQVQLVADLTTGTFVSTTECPGGAGTGLVGALQCAIPDLWIGVGDFKEVSYLPHNDRFVMAPYHHYLDITDDVQHVVDAVASFVADSNKDYPEATTQALYSVVTGQGLGDLVPNRAPCPDPGRWGYPCFRDNVLPIIVLVTDADFFNGPVANGHTYGNPPFDGTLGMGTMLPPVVQSPNVLYASDPSTAWNLGDMTNTSMTIMGSNVNLGNDAQTWDKLSCSQCGGSGCWRDGRDAFFEFSVSSAVDMAISGEGTAYHTTNVAIFDGDDLDVVDCNPGPTTGGDYWGRLTRTLDENDGDGWYAVSDASVSPGNSESERIGDFQLRFHNQTAHPLGDPSWQTADLPLTWTEVETELLATGVKIVNVVSPNSAGLIAIPDVTALAVATNSLDQYGDPYLEIINGDGSGLSTAILDAVRSLVGDTRRDVTLVPEDNFATPAVNEGDFVKAVTATTCPTTGIQNCTGKTADSCLGCLADTQLGFSFRLGNAVVAPSASPQVFDFDMIAVADGTAELTRIPVRVMVPEAGANFGAGFYENAYDSDLVCIMPPETPAERPDWGTLTWNGSTPSDSKVTFEFFTANDIADLDSVIPVSIVYCTDPSCDAGSRTDQEYDIGAELLAAGESNYQQYLRVRARLEASTDSLSTPIFSGWSMEFHCVPFD